jgi:hypothetical protein
MPKEITVVKESGEKELYDPKKVLHALKRTGLSEKDSKNIIAELESKLHDGIKTKKIYAMLYDLIDNTKPNLSYRYNLKRALFQMGPEGYGFETFMARLLQVRGYKTKTRQIVQGKCVNHEIDVIATKGSKTYMIECKFHNQPGLRCRIQTVLYVYSRFLDLQEGAKQGYCEQFTKPLLATNTKFSEDVLAYAQCMGIPLLGWRYPIKNSLEEMIDSTGCYPVTVLDMSNDTIRKLIAREIVTVADIPESPQELATLAGIPLQTAKQLIEKAEYAR